MERTKSRHTYIRACVQSTHVYVYATRRDEILNKLLFSFYFFSLPPPRGGSASRVSPQSCQSHESLWGS